jgi:cephalosporin-C deacetylase
MALDSDLLRPYVPADFEEFWRETTQQALDARLEYEIRAQEQFHLDHHNVEIFEFRGIDGLARHGWIARPESENSPGFMWLAPYSRWSMLPNKYGVRDGFASISFNFHGESAFHREEYTPARGYMAEGIQNRETWIFRRMYQDSVLVARLFAEQKGVDRDRIAAMGMSQGGGMAIWLGAWLPLIKAVVADEPFLAGVPWILSAQYFRYPLKELTDLAFSTPEKEALVRQTLASFDTINQATFCRVPTRVTLGLKDPSVRPPQVRAVHDVLPGVKELEEIDWGHDWHPRMIDGASEFLGRAEF